MKKYLLLAITFALFSQPLTAIGPEYCNPVYDEEIDTTEQVVTQKENTNSTIESYKKIKDTTNRIALLATLGVLVAYGFSAETLEALVLITGVALTSHDLCNREIEREKTEAQQLSKQEKSSN